MDLARAFTKRVKRTDVSANRAASVRPQISGPVALVSTTNMLSYNAPDIANMHVHSPDGPPSTAPSTPTRSSLDDSDASTPSNASTEATSVGCSPSTEHDPIDSHFAKSSLSSRLQSASALEDIPPTPPKRALSHSKREHERLARKRSLQFSRPASLQSVRDSIIARSSVDNICGNDILPPNELTSSGPFSRELEQLSEVAEEFGSVARDAAIEDDLAVMQSRGLSKFGVAEYLLEIQPLWDLAFHESDSRSNNVWI